MKKKLIIVGIIFITIMISVIVGLSFFVYKVHSNMEQQNNIKTYGTEADAIILDVQRKEVIVSTGAADETILKLLLKINPVSKPSFRVQIERAFLSSDIYLYQLGAKLKVRYDPNDINHIVIVSALPVLNTDN